MDRYGATLPNSYRETFLRAEMRPSMYVRPIRVRRSGELVAHCTLSKVLTAINDVNNDNGRPILKSPGCSPLPRVYDRAMLRTSWRNNMYRRTRQRVGHRHNLLRVWTCTKIGKAKGMSSFVHCYAQCLQQRLKPQSHMTFPSRKSDRCDDSPH